MSFIYIMGNCLRKERNIILEPCRRCNQLTYFANPKDLYCDKCMVIIYYSFLNQNVCTGKNPGAKDAGP